jgi:gliding motility-associated-like protein
MLLKNNCLKHSDMKKFIIFSLFSLLFISPKITKASHFAGSDLTYSCVGGNTYLITLTFYRDCGGVPAPVDVTVSFNCSSNPNFGFSATLSPLPGTGQYITQSCSIHQCLSYGINNGIQEYVYQATVTLIPCNSWEMKFTDCCRNNVTTVSSNYLNNFFIESELNNLQAPCNSSPYFSNKPISYACINQSFCFNHGVIDPNGDSLAYSFYAPHTTSSNTSVIYIPPYSSTNFLNSVNPISLNPLTGDICFTASTSLTTITGIRIEEWRTINGQPTLIGVLNRDMQLSVENCINKLPTLSGIDTLNTHTFNSNDTIYQVEMCLGPTIDFDINGFDMDTFSSVIIGRPDIFHISWNQGIPQGSFTTYFNGTDSAYAHFNWTPISADVSNVPKCFTATIYDEACPNYGSQTFSYCFIVKGMAVDIGPTDTLLCQGESLQLNAIADSNTVNYIWKWNGQPTTAPLNQTFYNLNTNNYSPGIDTLSIETNDGNTTLACPGRDFLIINNVYQPNIHESIQDSAFCDGSSLTYDAGQGTIYLWMRIAPNYQIVGANQTQIIDTNGLYTVFVDGGNNTRCNDQDTFNIISIPNPNLGNDTCIWLADAPLTLDGGFFTSVSYLWSNADTNHTIDVSNSDNYEVSFFNILNQNVKCSDSKNVFVIDQTNFITSSMVNALDNSSTELPIPSDRIICSHQRLKLFAIEPPGGINFNYQWYKDDKPITSQRAFILNETSEGNCTIKLNLKGCVDKINVQIEQCLVTPHNVITPTNVDGQNDYFKFDGLEDFPNSKIQIFNRWGEKIFETYNYQNDWNGNGSADGVYNWILYIADGKGTIMHGSVTIISK